MHFQADRSLKLGEKLYCRFLLTEILQQQMQVSFPVAPASSSELRCFRLLCSGCTSVWVNSQHSAHLGRGTYSVQTDVGNKTPEARKENTSEFDLRKEKKKAKLSVLYSFGFASGQQLPVAFLLATQVG